MKAGKDYPPLTSGKGEKISPAEARRRQRALGRRLRQMFDDVAQEPVPNEFLALLEAIDQQAPAAPSHSADGKGGETNG